jgi:hypothetical protein
MNIRTFLKKALWNQHFPLSGLLVAFHHLNVGKLQMSEINLIPGSQSPVTVVGVDSLGQEIALNSTVTGSVDNTAVATVTDGVTQNSVVVTGVSVGTANLTVASGGLSLVVLITVSADAPVALAVDVGAAVVAVAPEAAPAANPAAEPAAA